MGDKKINNKEIEEKKPAHNRGTSIALKVSVWMILLSILPIGVLLVFVVCDVEGLFIDEAAANMREESSLLAAQLSLLENKSFDQIMKQPGMLGMSEKYYGFIIDSDGIYIYHPVMKKVHESAYADFSEGVVGQILGNEKDGIILEEENLIIAHSSISAQRGKVVLVMNSALFLSDLKKLETTALSKLCISLLIVAFVSGFMIWFLFKPISKMVSIAKKVGQGNMNEQADISTMEGEILELGVAFNMMIRDLKTAQSNISKHENELEKQVEKRTKQLQTKLEEFEKLNAITIGRELRMVELKKKIKDLEEKLKKHKK